MWLPVGGALLRLKWMLFERAAPDDYWKIPCLQGVDAPSSECEKTYRKYNTISSVSYHKGSYKYQLLHV